MAEENNVEPNNEDTTTNKETGQNNNDISVELEYYKKELERFKKELAERKAEPKPKPEKEVKPNVFQQEEITRLTQELEELKKEKVTALKTNKLKEEAKKHGLKDNYFGFLNKFINLDEIPVENDLAPEIAIKQLKREMPDLFGSANISSSLPTPEVSSKYEAMTREEVAKQAAQLFVDRKMGELNQLSAKHNIDSGLYRKNIRLLKGLKE